ncbi:MAG TPA: hypothetical protein VKY90_00995 [Candidatus Dormibacteraeota bacterium]|nr:hypothetical protein [Candidatus Dormibacteraeota bacterium]
MAAYLTLAPIVAGLAVLVVTVWARRARLAEVRVPVRVRDPRRR